MCELTVDDPLVSRKHARLFIKSGEAWIEDLGSRNGVRVDGRAIAGPTVLHDGAHLRIGTQEMRLRRLEEERVRPARRVATGFLVYCTACARPYGSEETICPHCGQQDKARASTELSAPELSVPELSIAESAWSMELLVETMSRAASLGRTEDTERLLIQARQVLATVGAQVERRRLDQFAAAAIELALKSDSSDWAIWALQLFADRGLLPRPELGQRLSELPPSSWNSIFYQVENLLKAAALSPKEDSLDKKAKEALLLFCSSPPSRGPDTRDEAQRQPETNGEPGSQTS